MRGGVLLALAAGVALSACADPHARGERLYRDGDLRGAQDAWRMVPPASEHHEAAQASLAELATHLEGLAERHETRGAYFEKRGRLAEAILAYRLALEVRHDDLETLQRVQELSRTLVARKEQHQEKFDAAFAAGRLDGARREMTALRTLDPFDPDRAAAERALDQAAGDELERRLAEGRRQFVGGNLPGAEKAFRSALRLEPQNEAAQGYLAYIATIREIERGSNPARNLDPPPALRADDAQIRAESLHRNALAAERAGDPYKALRYDLAAVRADPDHAAAQGHIAKIRRRLKPRVDALIEAGRIAFGREDLEGALERWHRALLIDPENERAQAWTVRAERLQANLERLRAEPSIGSGPP